MNDDMTYQETARIKSNIQSFVEKIKELSQKIAIDEKDFNETKENKSEEEMDE